MANGAAGSGLGVRVTAFDDPGGDELADLHEWLRCHAGRIRIEELHRKPGPDSMRGGVLEALETAALSGEALSMVLTGIAGWVSARATTRRTRIRVKRGDVEVEIDTANVRDADLIARRLLSRLRG
jgi:hypothetical protein